MTRRHKSRKYWLGGFKCLDSRRRHKSRKHWQGGFKCLDSRSRHKSRKHWLGGLKCLDSRRQHKSRKHWLGGFKCLDSRRRHKSRKHWPKNEPGTQTPKGPHHGTPNLEVNFLTFFWNKSQNEFSKFNHRKFIKEKTPEISILNVKC